MDTLNQKPTIGRIVNYTLNDNDAAEINRRRVAANAMDAKVDGTGYVVHSGNAVSPGDVFPMLIVRVWGDTPESAVNGQVILDGNDHYWATSRKQGDGPASWAWPTRV